MATCALLTAIPVDRASANQHTATRTGSPVVIMTLGDFVTGQSDNRDWADAVRARFRTVNRRGGIADAAGQLHPVDVLVCNTASDSDRTEACTTKAVQMHVAAVIGMAVTDSELVWPILAAAGIPVIGPRVTSLDDVESPVAFPLSPGLPGIFTAMPQLLAREGATKIAVVVSDYGTTTDDALSFIDRGIATSGATAGPVIRVNPGSPDFADVAEALRGGNSDGVIGFVSGGHEGQLIHQLRLAGVSDRYVTQAPFGQTPLASDPSADTPGAFAVGEFALAESDAPGIKQYRKDMVGFRGMPPTEGAIEYWLAAWVFGRVASGLPRIDAPLVLAGMGDLDNLDMGGVTPPLTTATLPPGSPRFFNPRVTFFQVRGGQLAPISNGFFDPFEASGLGR